MRVLPAATNSKEGSRQLGTPSTLAIRDFAKVIHEKQAGKVVFVNLTEPAKSWNGVIDYWVEWDCDTWVQDLVGRQSALHCGNHGGQVRNHVLTVNKPY
jgi:NAD-dependent histone deacetylase SIR2